MTGKRDMQTMEQKALSRIYGKQRGWAFSRKDFVGLGSISSIDWAFHSLLKKEKIRRVMRGIYDYPKYGKKLGRQLSPDIDQVAQALARKFGWRIQPSGPVSLNILGLSTQVPGTYSYMSDGPNRKYTIGKTALVFRQVALKEMGFKRYESAIIVQALKSLGKANVSEHVILRIREWLDARLYAQVLKDTKTVTGWVYEAIRRICS